MTLSYFGISLANQQAHPLGNKVRFCTAKELAKVKISHEEYARLLDAVKALPYVNEATLISTCNRFEVIVDIEDSYINSQSLNLIAEIIQKETQSELKFGYLIDKDAKLQIIRTYCGLNSGLIGEDEICAQFNTAFRQAHSMGYIGNKCMSLLEEASSLRRVLNEHIYKQQVSYCDVAIQKSFEKFGFPRIDTKLNSIAVLGSGSTTQRSCLSLIKLGIDPQRITVIHRISHSSVQIENIKTSSSLQGINHMRSKNGYHTDKVKDSVLDSDLVIFGIDTKNPVIEFPATYKGKIIDFNSNPSCSFEQGFKSDNYIANLELDSFVRSFSVEQSKNRAFLRRIKIAEDFINESLDMDELHQIEAISTKFFSDRKLVHS
jgi:glutamyl-tRNA reductase